MHRLPLSRGQFLDIRQLPPGALPPLIINYSALSVPILQVGLGGEGMSEQQLNDLSQNFLRPQLVIVPGAEVPWPFGGKTRQVMIDLNTALLRAKGVSRTDVPNAVTNRYVGGADPHLQVSPRRRLLYKANGMMSTFFGVSLTSPNVS
jgi:multidrug efflux pump subunit AcrB